MARKNLREKSILDSVFVVLVNPLYSGNVGAVARSMANFNLSKLVIVGSFSLDEECRNRAKHANFILDNAIFLKTFDEARVMFDLIIGTSGVVGGDFNLPRSPLLVDEAVNALKDFKGRVGLFFGPEDSGLSNSELLNCDFVVNIPCSEDYGVMNLSHSATIIFYEFFKAFNDFTFRKSHVLASVKEKDVLYSLILSVLEKMNFRAESDRETQKVLWKRVVGKSFLSRREISSLLGFFRNTLYVLNKEEKKK
jgi:tRNA/rRNA methyltransferase